MMIGDKLFILRTNAAMTQEQVADAAEISRVTYTRYENGTRKPVAGNLAKIARVFGVTTDMLLDVDFETKGDENNPAVPSGGISKEEEGYIALLRAASPELRMAAIAMLEAAHKARSGQDIAAKDE